MENESSKTLISNPVFVSNEKISVKEFIEKWKNNLSEELSWIDHKDDDLTEMTVNQLDRPLQFIKSLKRSFNLDKFTDTLIKNSNLNVEVGTSESKFDSNRHSKNKYRHKWLNKTINVNDKHSDQCDHNNPLALLTVQIFRPAYKHSSKMKLQLDREYEILSCQKLTVLRDSYFCLSDMIHQSDYSENPDKSVPKKMKCHEKTGLYFIDDIYYYDDRFELESFDTIFEWSKTSSASSSSKKSTGFTKKSMNETRFEDLNIRLGYPYLYIHRNNCEHLLVFTDIRLFIPKIEQNIVDDYPKFTIMENLISIKCQMCQLYSSKWITMDNKRLPLSPYYFCHNCFVTFNYDQDLKKIGSFRAFPLLWDIN
ncbi:proximal sequence element A Pbp49 [Dermatophagoides pteronyssinus]|uniref:snRNA-activating protein complex subunit 3 n=1 Tax=Dermatophagoides pteronyssinus TaxID=6956 RepID=A0A6P6Y0X8_DERPT|nr:snRNA-activating protein complex subunit 3-like [Dermatophagoides pteronyssinus]